MLTLAYGITNGMCAAWSSTLSLILKTVIAEDTRRQTIAGWIGFTQVREGLREEVARSASAALDAIAARPLPLYLTLDEPNGVSRQLLVCLACW